MSSNRRIWIFTLVVLLIPLIIFQLSEIIRSKSSSLPVLGPDHHTIPDFSLTDHNGSEINLKGLGDKIIVADFFFSYCPTICPVMTSHVAEIQEVYAGDSRVGFVSFTVDPKRDTPERLREFAKYYGADLNQWTFITGQKKELYKLARNGFFLTAADGDGGPEDFIHSEKLILIDREKRIRGYYDGTNSTHVERLIKDIDKLKKSRV